MSAIEPGLRGFFFAGILFFLRCAAFFLSPLVVVLLVVVDAIICFISFFRRADSTVIEHMFLGLLASDIMLSLFWARLQEGLLAGGERRLGVVVL